MFLTLLACLSYPDEAPPLPSAPNRFDTAVGARDIPDFQPLAEGGGRPPTLKEARVIGPLRSGGDAKLAVSANDPDGDMVSTRATWFVNGEQVSTGKTLSSSYFAKGDRVRAEVLASDGRNEVRRVTEELEVQNSPPTFDVDKRSFVKIDGFHLQASDPDGDPLSYRVEDGPPGLSIDRDGVLHFSGSESQLSGSYDTRLIVSDPDGESIVWPLRLDVGAGSGAAP